MEDKEKAKKSKKLVGKEENLQPKNEPAPEVEKQPSKKKQKKNKKLKNKKGKKKQQLPKMEKQVDITVVPESQRLTKWTAKLEKNKIKLKKAEDKLEKLVNNNDPKNKRKELEQRLEVIRLKYKMLLTELKIEEEQIKIQLG